MAQTWVFLIKLLVLSVAAVVILAPTTVSAGKYDCDSNTCDCDITKAEFVCGSDGATYLNPCILNCTKQNCFKGELKLLSSLIL